MFSFFLDDNVIIYLIMFFPQGSQPVTSTESSRSTTTTASKSTTSQNVASTSSPKRKRKFPLYEKAQIALKENPNAEVLTKRPLQKPMGRTNSKSKYTAVNKEGEEQKACIFSVCGYVKRIT